MRIAIVDNLPEGGAKRVVFEQIKGLSQDHEIDYYTNTLVSHFPFADYVSQIHRFDLAMPRFHGITRIAMELLLASNFARRYRQMATLINKSGADIVIAHPCMITQSPLVLRYLTIPSVYVVEEWLRVYYEADLHPLPVTSFIKRKYEYLRRRILALADKKNVAMATRLVTTSIFNQDHVQKAYTQNSDLVPLGVDTDFFKPHKNASRNHFLFVGNKESVDGYDLLEEAISRTHSRPKIKYVSCNGISFTIDDEEMRNLYQTAVATLCLARSEPFGLVPLESMACGTPVIAVNEGGYRDTIIQDKTGRLIPRRPDALVEAMLSISQDKKAYEAMSRVARKRAVDTYDWSVHIRLMNQVIESVMHD
jgi:glycosyltransferase involved in cell wall biosynthesis